MIDVSWVLALMLRAEPSSPYRESFESTAAAIARAASAAPLFAGELGAEKTAALVVSVAWFESRFRPNAEGDHDCLARSADGRCARKGRPRSFCAMQVHESNFAALGVTREQVSADIGACVAAGLRMMRTSFGVCRALPLERRLDHYAVGGDGCARPPRDEGAHRVRKGLWLFGAVPLPKPA